MVYFDLKSGEDEDDIVRLSKIKPVILHCSDWTIIPLENLIAKGADVIAQVKSIEEAKTAFGILEKGVGHILFHADNVGELKRLLAWIRSEGETILLEEASIVDVTPIGMGDRVCVDTCTSMTMGQGMLVGNSSSALFLVHAESIANPYVAPRPFRVNAGPVHAYTRIPWGKNQVSFRAFCRRFRSACRFQRTGHDGNRGTPKNRETPPDAYQSGCRRPKRRSGCERPRLWPS